MSISAGARPIDMEEMLHGVLVRDPYRHFEDRKASETEAWIREQQSRYESYFASFHNLQTIRSRVRSYLDVDAIDQPMKLTRYYFYRHRRRGEEQGCLYIRSTDIATARLLVDPSKQGPFITVGIHRISDDSSLLAYDLRHGGEDRCSIHIVDVGSGSILEDRLDSGHARGFVFASDNRGFYYCHEQHLDASEHTISFHRFGDRGIDEAVFHVERTPGSRLVLIADNVHLGAIWLRQDGREWIEDFWIARQEEPPHWRQVFTRKEPPLTPLLSRGRIFAIRYEGAPNGKIIELGELGIEGRTVIPEQDTPLRQLVIAGDRFYVRYFEKGIHSIRCWNLNGKEETGIPVPSDGTIYIFPNHNSEDVLFYRYESFTTPPSIFEYCPNANRLLHWQSDSSGLDSLQLTIQHSTFKSKDGTTVPITLVSKESETAISPVPAIMTSYGGFGVPATPQFSVLVLILIELGAAFALPHIRSGGELGQAWHEAGRRTKRQASFDDFIAAAEWLHREGVTSRQQLAIFGGSNSGLLVGAAMVQRPELFRAVLCTAPLLDMVRYEQFDDAAKWSREYGTITEKDEFEALLAYSPYHNIQENIDYPATLFVSGDKDERCNPAHVRKMAARLIAREAQRNPILVDYSEQRGHCPAMPLSIRVEALTHRIAFLCRELNISLEERLQ